MKKGTLGALFVIVLLIMTGCTSIVANKLHDNNTQFDKLLSYLEEKNQIHSIIKYSSDDHLNISNKDMTSFEEGDENSYIFSLFRQFDIFEISVDTEIKPNNYRLYIIYNQDLGIAYGYSREGWGELQIGTKGVGGKFLKKLDLHWILLETYNRQSNPTPSTYDF